MLWRTRWRRGGLLPVLLAALAACSSDPMPMSADTGVVTDMGPAPDTGAPDTSPPADTGAPPQDTGTPMDGAGMDAGDAADAGDAGDAGDGAPGDAGDGAPGDGDDGAAGDVVGCPGELVDCSGRCVDTLTDDANCGACGLACAAGQACRGGVCLPGCPTGQTYCGSPPTCVNPQTDATNCGLCGNRCAAGQSCVAGACTIPCAAPRMTCMGAGGALVCADLTSDNAHCGACGNACPAGQACAAGACRMACPAGQSNCGDACFDLATDRANCGSCGNACPGERQCVGGSCVIVCPAGQTECLGTCVDTRTSVAHCGACGVACAAGQSCVASACACPGAQRLCGSPPRCTDTQTDLANCGTCGTACAAGLTCLAGACAMAPPSNDTRAAAITIDTAAPAATLSVNTTSAGNHTRGTCGCTTGPDAFYRFTLAAPELVYADTIGSSYNTVLFLQDAAGSNIADAGVTGGLACSDDGGLGCSIGTASAVLARLNAGTYYLVVSGCAGGTATLRFHHLPAGNGSVSRLTPSGMQSVSGATSGAGQVTGACCSDGPENTLWWVTCPDFTAQPFSAATCGGASWNTSLDQRSAARAPAATCDDDACGRQSSLTTTLPSGAGLHTLYVDGCRRDLTLPSAGTYSLALRFGACATGQTSCGAACVATASDVRNCGRCGTACATGGVCAAGVCACPPGQTNCSNRCTSTATDLANCGACGRACGVGQSCAAGACVCPAGQLFCGGRCVAPQTDNSNCGACGNACAAGRTCVTGVCRPNNDDRARAVPIALGAAEATVTGSNVGATFDGPGDCTAGHPNVWYTVSLSGPEVLYADTAGSAYDTRLYLLNSAGAMVAGSCNDDAGCATGGFTTSVQSRFAVYVGAGTYYLAVSGFSTASAGNFTLHVQHLPATAASVFFSTVLTGTGNQSSTIFGTTTSSRRTATCGGSGAEHARWFLTCGDRPQFFSLCASDGGNYSRRIGSVYYDPAVAVLSGISGTESVCNDDGGGGVGGVNCIGTATFPPMGADGSQYGSRINNVMVRRGIHFVYVEDRIGSNGGMNYNLRYAVNN